MNEVGNEITAGEIRDIRRSLGLSQVEAGEILGGGPRAFTKYEAGSVKPAAAVVNLLRLLDAHPEMIGALKGSKSRPLGALSESRPFEITGEHIGALTDRTFHLLLRRLLEAEALTHGLPSDGIHVAGNITAPDGGEDGRISWTEGPDRTSFLPSRLCQFQLKSSTIRVAGARKEVLTRNGEVKDMVRSAIAVGGHYIVLCTCRYTKKAISTREDNIRAALRGAGLSVADEQIQLRDADQIAAWANTHPSVAAWVIERTQPGTVGPFCSWVYWAARGEYERSPWVDDERLTGLRDFLLELVGEPQGIARVVGLSGIGKSRLVVEALGATEDEERDLSRSVLYVDTSEADSAAIHRVVQIWTETGARAIVVVDRCPPEFHDSLANLIARSGSRLSLVTIDNEIPSSVSDRTIHVLGEASHSVTEEVIALRAPGLDQDTRQRLARFADGYPGMAIRVAEAWTGERPVVHATEDHFVDAFVRGREPLEAELAVRAARFLSVFGSVLYDDPSCKGIGEIDGSLPAAELRIGIEELIRRGIAQRTGRFVRIQPRPIAARLAERQWRSWSQADWDKVLSGLEPHGLRILAARQLVWLGETDVSREVARHVCRRDGPLGELDGEAGAVHAEVLCGLAEIEPVAVVHQLERSLGAVNDLASVDGLARRHVVWALERVCFGRKTFEEGADLLLRLAVAENEPGVANNATGQFCGLFPMLLGATEADGEARLAYLTGAADTNDPDELAIVVEALVKATETSRFIRFGGSQRRGLCPDHVSWQPTTNEDARRYLDGCLDALASLCDRKDRVGAMARDGLGRHFRSLTANGLVEAVERAVERVQERNVPWRAAIESLSEFIQHDSAESEVDTVGRVRRLLEKLKPQDLAHRAQYLISDMPWHFPADEKLDIDTRRRRQEEAIRDVTVELVRQPDALREILPRLCEGRPRMAMLFGICLAELSADPVQWLEEINRATVNACGDGRNFDLLSGYLKGMADRFPEIVEKFKQTVSESSELAPALPLICWQLRISAGDITLALNALEAGLLPPKQLNQWTMGGNLSTLPTEVVSPLFDAMLNHCAAGFAAGIELMGMYVFGDPDKLEKLRPQICTAARNVLRWEGAGDGPIAGSHFDEIMQWMLAKGRKDADARSIALTLSRDLVEVSEVSSERFLAPLVPVLLAEFPEISWPLIGNAIVSDELRAWRFRFVLSNRGFGVDARGDPILALPEETMFAWCMANPDVAPQFAAGIVPVLAPANGQDGTRLLHPVMARLLDEFGDRPGVVEAVERNLNSFSWVGSVVPYLTYVKPLEDLRTHPRKRVRRWASNALRRVQKKIEDARNEDKERAALFES